VVSRLAALAPQPPAVAHEGGTAGIPCAPDRRTALLLQRGSPAGVTGGDAGPGTRCVGREYDDTRTVVSHRGPESAMTGRSVVWTPTRMD